MVQLYVDIYQVMEVFAYNRHKHKTHLPYAHTLYKKYDKLKTHVACKLEINGEVSSAWKCHINVVVVVVGVEKVLLTLKYWFLGQMKIVV